MESNSIAFAVESYKAARDELVTRIKLRDNVLLVFLGFSGVIFGIVFGSDKHGASGAADLDWRVSLVIPFLALGCAIIVAQHNAVIGALIRYVANDLKPWIQHHLGGSPEFVSPPEFVSSRTFKDHSMWSNRMRTYGHLVILTGPSIFALVSNWHAAFYSAFPLGEVWWAALICFVFFMIITFYAHNIRKDVYNATLWDV